MRYSNAGSQANYRKRKMNLNHVEALKLVRTELKKCVSRLGMANIFIGCDEELISSSNALAATVIIDPVATSIDSKKFQDSAIYWSNEFSSKAYKASENAWLELVQHIDAHCAAQVAQALATKPAPSDEEIEAMVVWMGDPNDPYFDRIAFARSVLSSAMKGAK